RTLRHSRRGDAVVGRRRRSHRKVMTMIHASEISRRELLTRSGLGFGAIGLASLMRQTGLLDATPAMAATNSGLNPLAPKQPHFPAKAKRVIHLFMNGGPSHVDTFDPKPALDKYHGKELPFNLATERKTGAAFRSP